MRDSARWISILLVLCVVTISTNRSALAQIFEGQTRLGSTLPGDQWEPTIAADRYGHVYVLIPDFPPSCKGCPSSSAYLQISNDNGKTWSAPNLITSPASEQIDVQLKVDPVDGRTVYASWLQNNKSVIEVAKSTNFGQTWTTVQANSTQAGTDKDILAVRGNDVYVAYDHSQTVWCSASHDGGRTWTSVKVNANAAFGWSLTGGGTVDPAGNVYFSWDGYKQNGQAKGPVNLYITKSADRGVTWTSTLLDISASPPTCSAFSCGWAFLGPGIAMTSDAAGQLYVLWNSGAVDQGPERIYFSTSTDQGNTWSPRADVSLAPIGIDHAFPSLTAGTAGDVRIAWMDQRNEPHWNLYYRTSLNGGSSWSGETTLSTYVSGYSYIFTDGFRFPFGDYFDMDIDSQSHTQVAWAEGYAWTTPGNVWYTRELH